MNQLLVGDIIGTAARRTPNRPAASLGDRVVTFQEVDAAADRLTSVLAGRGVRRGDRVAWWGDTTLDVIPLYFALAHLGAMFVPLNPRYSDSEADGVLAQADPRAVICDEDHRGEVTLTELLAEGPPSVVEVEPPQEDDGHVIFFTSGTTGQPKGCVLTQRTQRLRAGSGSWPVGPNVCMFPQFHMAGWASNLTSWLSCDEVAYVERPDAEGLLSTIDRRRGASIYCIPAVWRRLLDADRSAFDLSSLRQADTGTSSTPPELLVAIAEAFPGTVTTVNYGSTEASSVCTLWPQDVLRKPKSVGPPSPGVYLRTDENDELWVNSAQLFSGYYNNPEATAQALVDGWYRTGELAEVDDEGYYYITGRASDIVRTGGETVAPAEVDLVLQAHPAVLDAAVAGVPHDDWGEVLTAFVVLAPGHSLDVPELRRHCEGRLATFKHPRQVVVVDQIPRTGATGQVQRRRLVELALAER